ncbi:MAG: FAD-dependent oxidoreductase, partial [Xanthobacteraceae bacterium]
MREVDATQILIVGAGPVGLSLAIELGLRGVAVAVVERRSRTGASRAPRPPMFAPCN